MPNVLRRMVVIAAVSMLFGIPALQARVITYSGKCAEGKGEWIIIMTLDDSTGRVTHLEGSNCAGEHWVGHCGRTEGNRAGIKGIPPVERPSAPSPALPKRLGNLEFRPVHFRREAVPAVARCEGDSKSGSGSSRAARLYRRAGATFARYVGPM